MAQVAKRGLAWLIPRAEEDSARAGASSEATASSPAESGWIPRVRFMVFSACFMFLGFVITVINIPTIALYPVVHRMHPLPYDFYLKCSRLWGLLQTRLFFSIKLIDHHHIPDTGGLVVVANHQSNLDFMALWHLKRRCIILSKREVLLIPFLGTPWSFLCGHIMVNRKDKESGRKAIERGVELAKKGYAVFVFPEGTRRSGYQGKVQEAKMGAFKMAKAAGVPLVPLTIRGTNKIMPNHDKANFTAMYRGQVEVYVHPCIDTTKHDIATLKTMAMERLQSKLLSDD